MLQVAKCFLVCRVASDASQYHILDRQPRTRAARRIWVCGCRFKLCAMNSGWVKIHRQIQENAFCYGNVERLGFWAFLLLLANHEEKEFYIGSQKVTCKKGEFVTGRDKLAEITGLNSSKIERHLNILVKEKMIEQQTSTKFRIIKIKNWHKYQVTEQQMNNKRTTDEQQMNTNKNDKNYKNEKNTYTGSLESKALYDSIDDMCNKYELVNKVTLKGLQPIVDRYVGKIKMKVELQHCISWLLDKKLRSVSTQRIGNWFKKALEIQKREELRQKQTAQRKTGTYESGMTKLSDISIPPSHS